MAAIDYLLLGPNVGRSSAKYLTEGSSFETLENQLRLQTPISTFFDAVAACVSTFRSATIPLSVWALRSDLLDRAVSPYMGIHYERMFGETADLAREDGEQRDHLYAVVGAKMLC